MPAKYSHVKKRSASGLLKKGANEKNGGDGTHNNNSRNSSHNHSHPHSNNSNNSNSNSSNNSNNNINNNINNNFANIGIPLSTLQEMAHGRALSSSPHLDRSITQAMTAVSQLERAIARIFLLRYELDIARLFSTRIYTVSLVHLPTLVMRCVTLAGPTWLVHNYDCEEIKDFFRAAIIMDLRQAGERVATKSVLWSYTALRHFALSNNVPICANRGLHSLRLLPYFPALKSHMDALEAAGPPTFSKPPHLGSLQDGQDALEDACELKFCKLADFTLGGSSSSTSGTTFTTTTTTTTTSSSSSATSTATSTTATQPYPGAAAEWEDPDWRRKIRYGYDKLCLTLWRVAREFDVRGYGNVLRDKLTTKWCDCGCSTDHLGEVCERTVREEEMESGIRPGKQREWDGRGSGVYGWETEEEEDLWECDLDFGNSDKDDDGDLDKAELTIAEMMEYRFVRAEREKEEGNVSFRRREFLKAVKHYETAHDIEPEVPHYQLNLAAAHLKLNNWIEVEKACTKALGQHKNIKGYYRRARARRMMNKVDEAIKDLRAALRLHPNNMDAITELAAFIPQDDVPLPAPSKSTPSSSSSSSSSKPNMMTDTNIEYINEILDRLNIPRPKQAKPPPFPPTKDERKLRITLMTLSASDYEECLKGEKCRKKDKDHKCTAGHKSKAKATVRETEKSMSKPDVVYFPGWDKYVVKKGDA